MDIGPQRPRVTIGRNADCIIQTNNASVSREHAVVVFQGGAYLVQDPPPGPPTNGTYVNGQRLRPGEVGRLGSGDELRCGNFQIMLYADDVPVSPGGASGPGHRPSAPMAQPEMSWNGGATVPPGYGPPASGGPYGPPPVAGGGISREEYEALVRENIGLKTVEQRQREQIEHLQNQNLDKERVLVDLERRAQAQKNVEELLNEKLAKLKEQLEQQKDQLRALREDLKAAHEHNEDLEFKLNALNNAASARSDSAASNEALVADLKVQINQRDRRLEDLRRELDLAQYALTTEKDNVERLELALRQVNDETSSYERYRQDIQRVIEQHEGTIADLRRAIEDRDRDRERLIAQLDTLSAGSQGEAELRAKVTRLEEALRQRDEELHLMERQLRESERNAGRSLGGPDPAEVEALRRQVAQLEAELAEVGASDGGGGGGDRLREVMQQLNALKRENRDLRMQVDSGGGAAGGGAPSSAGRGADPELQRKIIELEKELDETRQRMRELQRAGGGGAAASGELDDLRRRVKTVYQSINDVVSQWREDMQSMELYIADLQRLIQAYQRIDMNSLNTVDRVRLEGVVEEIDPRVTFEEINTVITKNQNNAGSIKSSLRDLREVLL